MAALIPDSILQSILQTFARLIFLRCCLKPVFLGHLGGSVSWVSDFGSGHDLMVMSLSPASGSVLTGHSLEPALDSVSPSLSAPHPLFILSLSLSLSQK